jgi:hypothetical protein
MVALGWSKGRTAAGAIAAYAENLGLEGACIDTAQEETEM